MKKLKNILKSINPFSRKDPDNKILYVVKIILITQLIYFVTLILAEVLIIGISMPFGYNATDKQLPSDVITIISFFGYIIPILTFILYTKKVNKSTSDRIGLDKNYKKIIKGILIGIITTILSICPLILCGAVKYNGINTNINWLMWILTFFAYLTQSALEEVICRGFILHRLKEKLPILLAVIISIVFFMIGHLNKMFDAGIIIGLIGILNAILISLIFTTLTLKDKNIYAAIGFHWLWNALLYCVIGLNLSGNDASNSLLNLTVKNDFLTGSSYGIESGIITTLVYTVVLFICLKSKNKNK